MFQKPLYGFLILNVWPKTIKNESLIKDWELPWFTSQICSLQCLLNIFLFILR